MTTTTTTMLTTTQDDDDDDDDDNAKNCYTQFTFLVSFQWYTKHEDSTCSELTGSIYQTCSCA